MGTAAKPLAWPEFCVSARGRHQLAAAFLFLSSVLSLLIGLSLCVYSRHLHMLSHNP